jgi:hypothetical protein
MSYMATIFRVMIASPSDIGAERSIVREVLAEWNAVHSEMRTIVLLPLAWETHTSPEMGDRPQAIINKQILKNCDLLVGVFWTRIGTSTGKYPSGTVEEIEEHIKTGRPVMLYFSSMPVLPDSVDPDQYAALANFKESCKVRGLLETYSDINDFKTKFYRQLQLKLNSEAVFTCVSTPSTSSQVTTASGVPDLPALSREAQILLKEASQDPNGNILRLPHLGGLLVQSNGKEFVRDNNPRQRAAFEGAIEELEDLGLIKAGGYKREVFEITREGFRLAELIIV